MSIADLKKAVRAQKKEVKTDPIFAITFGCSGAGKSYLIGTLELPTLYMYLSSERHGPSAASSTNDNIVPVCLDKMEEFDKDIPELSHITTGTALGEAQTLIKLRHYSLLNLKSDGFGAIALDSLSDLEHVIKATPDFKQSCMSTNGKYSKFNESDELVKRIRNIIINLQHHIDEGIHVVVTCAGTIQAMDDNSGASIVQPKLSTWGVVDSIPRLFPEVLLVTRAKFEDKVHHVLTFEGNLQKISKDATGKPTKLLNFSPRITGLSTQDLPEYLKADLKEVLKLKNKNVNTTKGE